MPSGHVYADPIVNLDGGNTPRSAALLKLLMIIPLLVGSNPTYGVPPDGVHQQTSASSDTSPSKPRRPPARRRKKVTRQRMEKMCNNLEEGEHRQEQERRLANIAASHKADKTLEVLQQALKDGARVKILVFRKKVGIPQGMYGKMVKSTSKICWDNGDESSLSNLRLGLDFGFQDDSLPVKPGDHVAVKYGPAGFVHQTAMFEGEGFFTIEEFKHLWVAIIDLDKASEKRERTPSPDSIYYSWQGRGSRTPSPGDRYYKWQPGAASTGRALPDVMDVLPFEPEVSHNDKCGL
jgi:hypothetical protein